MQVIRWMIFYGQLPVFCFPVTEIEMLCIVCNFQSRIFFFLNNKSNKT
jgi:hypothetical protein